MELARLQEEIQAKIKGMAPAEKDELMREVVAATGKWAPSVGPQLMAANSEADVLLYGGQGGGGKTDLLIGLAMTEHDRSLIMRRKYSDLGGLTERAVQVNGTRNGYSGAIPPKLRTTDGRLIEFGGAKSAGDGRQPGDEGNWQGQPHDFLGIDEATQFAESQIRFLMGWLRSTKEGQRCRTVLATNPPLSTTGDWVVVMFAPWLDPKYPKPAKPGELRWVVTLVDENTGKSRDMWVDGPDAKILSGDYNEDGTERYLVPKSRTFIPSRVQDNPYLRDTNYQAELDALPEPIRSAVRDGNFMAAREDEANQVIPTLWVKQAQERWLKDPPRGIPQCAIGVDGSRQTGGDDGAMAIRHDGWFAPIEDIPGGSTPHGRDLAALIVIERRDNAEVTIDCLESIGAQAAGHLEANSIEGVNKFFGNESTTEKTAEKNLGFYNRRAAAYWRLREALDPSQDGGSLVALPDDPELTSDLTTPTWEPKTRDGEIVIKLTPKDKVIETLGRSPNKGDAVVMCWYKGPRAMTHMPIWQPDERVGPAAQFTSRKIRSNFGPRHRRR